MTVSEDEDEHLAQFLESEVLSEISDKEDAIPEKEDDDVRQPKRLRVEQNVGVTNRGMNPRRIDDGFFSRVPPELFPHILKFLSSEDLVACSLVCRFLNFASSDESLWRRLSLLEVLDITMPKPFAAVGTVCGGVSCHQQKSCVIVLGRSSIFRYCMRWGILPPTKKLRDRAWKKLYIQRDEEDMVEFVRNCPNEFKEYYIQMQVAKRSQAPLPSQLKDDWMILDKSIADQVSIWKSNKGLTDKVFSDHACSGETCSYYQIGDVFVCENTGYVHVCDDTCKEVVLDPDNELLVCTISGHCFDRLLSPSEIGGDIEQGGAADEAEPFMGSGRFARAYQLGYNCEDEKELEACLRFC